MYAIIETGGKQFKVEQGLMLKVAKLDAEPGAEVAMDKVLFVADGQDIKVGSPYVEGAKVDCEVVEHGRGKKIIVFKKKRRHDYARKQGHRQDFTTIKVKTISA